MGLPNTQVAGDCLVAGSGVLRYWRMALWNASTSRFPSLPIFPEIRRLTVFTPTSARQLLWGKATELRRW